MPHELFLDSQETQQNCHAQSNLSTVKAQQGRDIREPTMIGEFYLHRSFLLLPHYIRLRVDSVIRIFALFDLTKNHKQAGTYANRKPTKT